MSSEKDLRKRLEELNRRPLPERAPAERAAPDGSAAELDDLRRVIARQRAKPSHAPPRTNPSDAPGPARPPDPRADGPRGLPANGAATRLERVAPESLAAPPPDAIVYRRDLPQPGRRPVRPDEARRSRAQTAERHSTAPASGPSAPPSFPHTPILLDHAVTGEELVGPDGGHAFLVASDVRAMDEQAAELCEAFRETLGRADSAARRWIAALCEAADLSHEDLLFVDLETTGLGGTPLFLIGTMGWESGGLVVRQYFARHYGEEAAVIALFLGGVVGRKLLVSFNGKTFDLPYVRTRAAANGVRVTLAPEHLDLLQVARRIWRGQLPDCRLQTIERQICGRMRFGDIPGSEIPQAYHDFVRTGDARVMAEVLRHNMLDLVTLADLMVRLPAPREQ